MPENKRNFDIPCHQWIKNGKIFRIDRIKNQYRLLIINQNTKTFELELYNGDLASEGTMSNLFYSWKSGSTIYTIYFSYYMDEAYFSTISDGKETVFILQQPGEDEPR